MGNDVAVLSEKVDIQDVWSEFYMTHGDDSRNLLIEHYRDIVRYSAERLHTKLSANVELDDLISSGIFGLMDAIDAYDPDRGVNFETYCAPRIKGSILDEIRRMDWVPRLVRSRTHQLSKATQSLEKTMGWKPSLEEIAKELDMDEGAFYRLRRDAKVAGLISLNTKRSEGKGDKKVYELDVIKDKKSVDPYGYVQSKDFWRDATQGLNRAERLIVVLYYEEEMTMKEIGGVLDLSESRVSQMHSSIISRLKVRLESKREEFGYGKGVASTRGGNSSLIQEGISDKIPFSSFVQSVLRGAISNTGDSYNFVANNLRADSDALNFMERCGCGDKHFRVSLKNVPALEIIAQKYISEFKDRALLKDNEPSVETKSSPASNLIQFVYQFVRDNHLPLPKAGKYIDEKLRADSGALELLTNQRPSCRVPCYEVSSDNNLRLTAIADKYALQFKQESCPEGYIPLCDVVVQAAESLGVGSNQLYPTQGVLSDNLYYKGHFSFCVTLPNGLEIVPEDKVGKLISFLKLNFAKPV